MFALKQQVVISTVLAIAVLASATVPGQTNSSASDRVQSAAQKLQQQQKFLLSYKFKQGEEIRWDVEHVASTKAQISGKDETTSSRTQSRKLWAVSSIDSVGNITFVHSVESTSLWQQIGEEDPVAYDSQSDEEPPMEFAGATDMIGKPLAVITITPSGKVVERKSSIEQINFGIGDICVPLPEKPIAVGHRWYVPTEFTATDEDGKLQRLKARLHYKLTKVVEGKAYIAFQTEVLTPIDSDKVKSQLLQKMTDGYIAFDMNLGRIAKKEIEWNEKVQEYAGPDSFLQYTGRMTEQLVRSAVGGDRVSKKGQPEIKRPGDKPIIRK